MADLAPIEPSEKFGNALSMGSQSSTLREKIIAVAVIVTLVMTFVFIGLYASALKSGDAGNNNNGVTAAQQMRSTPTPDPRICNTHACLRAAAYARKLMNASVDPCEDFYTYACGAWPNVYPVAPNVYRTSPLDQLLADNEQKIKNMVAKEIQRDMPWTAERKVKDLYQTCMNDYGRMAIGGNPIIDQVLNKIGGCWLLKDLPDGWTMLKSIEKVHVDFWTRVLFHVAVWDNENGIPTIYLVNGFLGMGSNSQYLDSYNNKTRWDYRAYIRKVANLLVRDAKVPDSKNPQDRVNTFVEDVMNFETSLANATTVPWGEREDGKLVTLQYLNNRTHNLMDWVAFMKYLIPRGYFTDNTQVYSYFPDDINRTFDMIQDIPTVNRNRVLNNFFVWSVVRLNTRDLSYEYIAAQRQFYMDVHHIAEPEDPSTFCFQYVKRNMQDALSHIFISDHFADDNKKKVVDIAKYAKQALVDGIDEMGFMDKETKQKAKARLSTIYETIGYPAWLTDTDSVDMTYHWLNISKTNHFANVMNMNKFEQLRMGAAYQGARDVHTSWKSNAFNTHLSFYPTIHKLIAPAGALQSPVYDYHNPHYVNFGSIGTMFTSSYLDVIDEFASNYQKDGYWFGAGYKYGLKWWSQATQDNYVRDKHCLRDYITGKFVGSYTDYKGQVINVTISPSISESVINDLAEELGALKGGYNAYDAWRKANSEEKMLPIIERSNEQMFFISYAQTKCFAERYYFPSSTHIPDDLKLNTVVAMLDEFSSAFSCSVNSTLNVADKCSVF